LQYLASTVDLIIGILTAYCATVLMHYNVKHSRGCVFFFRLKYQAMLKLQQTMFSFQWK